MPVETSTDLDQLAAALAGFQAEMPPVAKTATNTFFGSKYADLASIVAHAAPVAAKHGLAVSQHPVSVDGRPGLATILMHTSGQFVRSETPLEVDKPGPQGAGSALTYFRRYGLCAALGIVADDDDDGQEAQRHAPQRQTDSRGGWPQTYTEATISRLHDDLVATIRRLPEDQRDIPRRFRNEYGWPLPHSKYLELKGVVDQLLEQSAGQPDDPEMYDQRPFDDEG